MTIALDPANRLPPRKVPGRSSGPPPTAGERILSLWRCGLDTVDIGKALAMDEGEVCQHLSVELDRLHRQRPPTLYVARPALPWPWLS